MTITNPAKLIVVIVAMAAATALSLTHAISGDAAIATIMSCVGYIVGNGIAARTGVPVTPIIGPRGDAPPPVAPETP